MKGNQHHLVLYSMVKLYGHLYIGIMLSIKMTFDKQLMVWLQKIYCFCLAELLFILKISLVVHVQVVLCYVFVLTWCMYYHFKFV